MDRWEFEDICTRSRLKPVFRHSGPNAVVLIADGHFQGHPERPYPHHRTVWAIGLDENDLKFGRDLYFKGAENETLLDERIAAACEDALVAHVGLKKAHETLAEYMNPEVVYDGRH